MTHILHLLWNTAFLVGLAVGITGYHCFASGRCFWLNKHHPLPDGTKRHHRISNVWAGGIVVSLVLLYIIAQNDQRSIKAEECYREFTGSIIAYAKISEENDRLSREHRALLTEHNNATVDFVNKRIYPPAEIAALTPNDSRRQAWEANLTRSFFEQIQRLSNGMRVVEAKQDDVEQWRRDHPIEKLKCGVVTGDAR